MGRVGNSLDNREVEYFFGRLKGEYLNHIKTYTMNIDEIRKHISWYINWYNTKRIQKKIAMKNTNRCKCLCNLKCRIISARFTTLLIKYSIQLRMLRQSQ